jgi:hypothetical protein
MSVRHKVGILIATVIVTAAAAVSSISVQSANAVGGFGGGVDDRKAPIATSGNNIYIAWWSNKTGNDEVMFKASGDGGKTFADKMNLSNTPNSRSQDVEVAASDNNVYVTWWERNQTMNDPVMKVSNDNGKSFGPIIMLSNTTSGSDDR